MEQYLARVSIEVPGSPGLHLAERSPMNAAARSVVTRDYMSHGIFPCFATGVANNLLACQSV